MINCFNFPQKFLELPTYGKNLYILVKLGQYGFKYVIDNRKDLAIYLGVDVTLAGLAVEQCMDKKLIKKIDNKLYVRD
jgi:hypothetical protein